MSISLAQATSQLNLWVGADAAVAAGQSYTINGRSLTRSDAGMITEKIQYWSRVEAQLQRISNGQSKVSTSVARFSDK